MTDQLQQGADNESDCSHGRYFHTPARESTLALLFRAKFFGELRRALCRRGDRLRKDCTDVVRFEMLQRRLGGAALRCHLLAQRRREGRWLRAPCSRSHKRFRRRACGDSGDSPSAMTGCFEHLDQQEKIRRPAAGNCSHRVHVLFRAPPTALRRPRREFLRRACGSAAATSSFAYSAVMPQPCSAGRFGIAAHDRNAAGPTLNVGRADAGRDRDQQRTLRRSLFECLSATLRSSCGFTASTTTSASRTASALCVG